MKNLMIIVLMLLATAALAGPSTVFNYQGFLSDPGGLPLDGKHDLTFRIYDVGAGADPALWTELHLGVPVSDGVFSVLLGSLTVLPPSVLGSAELYIGVTLETGTEIVPRLQVTSTPWAYRAAIADSAVVSGAGGSSGGTVTSVGTGAGLTGGPITTSGTIGVATGGITGTMIAANTITGGNIATNAVGQDEIAPASVGSSEIASDAVTSYKIAPNAVLGSSIESSTITSRNLASYAVTSSKIATNAVGGSKIANGSVTSLDLADEPGVVSTGGGSGVDLTIIPQTIVSATITPPASGYVVASASAYGLLDHTQGSASELTISISTVANIHYQANSVVYYLPSSASSGLWRSPLNLTDVFSVTGGVAKTFYCVADADYGIGNDVYRASITLMFFPTSYGSVFKVENPAKDLGE